MQNEVLDIEISKLVVGLYSVRGDEEDDSIADLAASIGRIGLINPLCVAPEGDVFTVIAGHRRLAACKRAGLSKVRCVVVAVDEGTRKETALAENIFRQDITPVELACSLADILNAGTMTIEQIASVCHRSVHYVNRYLGILNWPDDVIACLQQKVMSMSAAENIALIPDEGYRGFLIKHAVENGATARTTAAWLQSYRSQIPPEIAKDAEPLADGSSVMPAVPQAPCLCCGNVFRTDELSHVPVCMHCIKALQGAVTR